MRLDDLDTKRLRYNPKGKDFIQTLIKDIPEFGLYGAKKKKLPREKVFGYIAVLYDIDSPIKYEVIDYYEKKREVAEMFEFDKKEDGYWEEHVEEMLTGQNGEVNELVAAFISRFGSSEYVQKIAYTEMLKKEMESAMKGGKNKDTIANIDKLTTKLKEVDRILFQSGKTDEVEEARRALYAKVERDRIKIRPEEIVKIMEETGALPKEFDQYPKKNKKTGKREKKPTSLSDQFLHLYKEGIAEREKRKKEEENVKK